MTARIITFLLLFTILALALASYELNCEECRDEPSFEKCADDEIEKIITNLNKDKWEAEYRTKMNECLTMHC